MVEIFIYDGSTLVSKDWLDWLRTEPGFGFQKLLEKSLKRLRPRLRRYFLLRTVADYDDTIFSPIDSFLERCVRNGNDRTDPSKWGYIPSEEAKILERKGYSTRDIVLAQPASRSDPNPYSWFGADEGVNVGILILDDGAYENLSEKLYGQKDIEKRREGLRGIILFDNKPHSGLPRQDLHFKLNQPLHIHTQHIRNAGYFC